jgi:hypothetical protein
VTAYTPAATRRLAKRKRELLASLFPVLEEVIAFSAV